MKVYTPLVHKALHIAYEAHHGQMDASGVPYIYHPAFLAAEMETEDEIILALLHDVVEDTAITFEFLEQQGFPAAILSALRLLTREEGMDYLDFVRRIKAHPLAAKVKKADVRHNSHPMRNANLPPEDVARYREKYAEAMKILTETP